MTAQHHDADQRPDEADHDGASLFAILDELSEEELRELNLPNARPLLYEFGPELRPVRRGGRYLDPTAAAEEAAVIAAQGGT